MLKMTYLDRDQSMVVADEIIAQIMEEESCGEYSAVHFFEGIERMQAAGVHPEIVQLIAEWTI